MVTGLVVLGTTGEAATITSGERHRVPSNDDSQQVLFLILPMIISNETAENVCLWGLQKVVKLAVDVLGRSGTPCVVGTGTYGTKTTV